MKAGIVFYCLMALMWRVFAQADQALDTAQFANLSTDSVYAEARRGFTNLNHPPLLRLQYVKLGQERAKKDGDYQLASQFASSTAVVYAELGLYENALESALNALEFAGKTATKEDDIWTHLRLSDINFILKDVDRGLKHGREALRLSISEKLNEETAWSYNALGEIYRQLVQVDSAEYYYEKGLAIFEETGLVRGRQFLQQNLGLTYTAAERYDEALQKFALADSIGGEGDVLYTLEQGEALLEIVKAKYGMDSAVVFGQTMLQIAQREDYSSWEATYQTAVAELLRQKGNWAEAWQHQRAADSLNEIQTGERILLQSSVTQHEYELKLLEVERDLQVQQDRNRLIFWIAVILVVALIGIVVIIQIVQNRRIRLINVVLSRKNGQLDELVKEKDIWINLMAHDLKAPLNAIKGLLGVLQDENLPAPMREKVMANITNSVDKGAELITQLLEISRLESGEVTAEIRSTNLSDLVAETVQTFQPIAENKNIKLLSELPTEPIELPTDPVLAQRILENFVSNAIKFSPRGKQVQVKLNSSAEAPVLYVIDQGPGLSAEDQANLFQKFRKLSARPTGGESSTGLGLSIVKLLADRIRADIRVSSTPGEGAQFSLHFPKRKTRT
ncbi:MAG: tetratricopeptide repeat-containing sensor histidine kinase [Bacteroidota bacterium]